MKRPNNILRDIGFGRQVVKHKAHALTLFSVTLALPSFICIFVIVTSARSSEGLQSLDKIGLLIMLSIVALNLVAIIISIYFWTTEKSRKVLVVKTGGFNIED